MIAFAGRCLRVYFRDRGAVFFSLLSVIIVIGLYALFLRDMMLAGWPDLPGVAFLMDSWLVSGMLAVTAVTTALGTFGVLVEDRVRGVDRDFACSPAPRSALAGGYIAAGCAVSLLMSLAALVLGEAYLVFAGGTLLPLPGLLRLLGAMALSVLASSAVMFCFVTCFHSSNAFSGASIVIGTLIGFVTGTYIPIGSLPEAVQWLIRLIPFSHSAALYRQALMEAPLASAFAGAPAGAAEALREELGVTLAYGSQALSPLVSALALAATALVFYALGLWNLARKRR